MNFFLSLLILSEFDIVPLSHFILNLTLHFFSKQLVVFSHTFFEALHGDTLSFINDRFVAYQQIFCLFLVQFFVLNNLIDSVGNFSSQSISPNTFSWWINRFTIILFNTFLITNLRWAALRELKHIIIITFSLDFAFFNFLAFGQMRKNFTFLNLAL